jgi:hypothetical protein
MQSSATRGAADKASASLQQTRADLQPWRETGQNALMIAGNLAGANGPQAATAAMANFQQSPGYAFQMEQGLRAIDAGAASQGILRSGATQKREMAFGEGLASQEFENYYNRLYNLSGMGFKAAGGQGDANTQMANMELGAGNAQSSIYGNTAAGLGTSISGLGSNPQFQNWWNGGNSAVSPTAVGNNALYQNAAFNQFPTGTYGPFA